MKTYTDLLLLAVIVVYIVDVSGFTDAWRGALARMLNISPGSLRELKPFDCGQCCIWWCCLIYSACVHQFKLETIAFAALLSLLSVPIGQLLMLIKEKLLWLINKVL